MSEKFTVPEGVINRINEIFPNSDERRKIAYTLMFWNKNPIGSERQEIGEKVGRERTTVNIIVRKLNEEGLMTEEFGSVPLFRYMENMRLSQEIPQDTVSITPDNPLEHPENTSDLSEPLEEEGVEHDLQEVDKPPTSVDMPISKELEKRVALTEANIKGLETTIDTRFNKVEELINNLSVHSKADNSSNLNPVETSQTPIPPVMVTEELVKRTIKETLNKMQQNNPEIAVADLEEIPDVILPSMDLEKENPLDTTGDSVIELDDAIISKKTVGFTPKSLMLFSLTRKKGFRGNFADFVNSCIDSALKGRNFKLTIVEDVE